MRIYIRTYTYIYAYIRLYTGIYMYIYGYTGILTSIESINIQNSIFFQIFIQCVEFGIFGTKFLLLRFFGSFIV